jgi:hypothetical protein
MNDPLSGRVITTLLLLCLGGCTSGNELAATEVLNNTNCKGAETGLRKVGYAQVAALRGSTLLSMSSPDSTDTAAPGLLLFALSKGRQPTPGYSFSLLDARLKDGKAELTLRWHSPEPESIQAQVITYPCIVIGVEQADYSIVRAVDENGDLLGELRL